VKVRSVPELAGTDTVPATVTAWKAAVTVTVRDAAAALRTGTVMLLSAVPVPVLGRSGRVVCTCVSPMSTSPVGRSRTWFQMPVPRSRTAGIQSQPEAHAYVGASSSSSNELTQETPFCLSPGLPGGMSVMRAAMTLMPSAGRSTLVTSKAARANG
jgi:hypothetical protein